MCIPEVPKISPPTKETATYNYLWTLLDNKNGNTTISANGPECTLKNLKVGTYRCTVTAESNHPIPNGSEGTSVGYITVYPGRQLICI